MECLQGFSLAGEEPCRGAREEVGHLLCACDLALALCGMSLHSYLVSLVTLSLRRARFLGGGMRSLKGRKLQVGQVYSWSAGSSFSVPLQASLSSHFKLLCHPTSSFCVIPLQTSVSSHFKLLCHPTSNSSTPTSGRMSTWNIFPLVLLDDANVFEVLRENLECFSVLKYSV